VSSFADVPDAVSDSGLHGSGLVCHLYYYHNFQPRDHEIVLGWFEAEEDREAQHSLGMAMREFWKQHPDQTTQVPMLRSLYEKGPCSFCRERAVNWLIELDALTKELRAECAYDTNIDIRDLVR
jgi:hypothetical protein